MAINGTFHMAVNWFIRAENNQIQNFMNHPLLKHKRRTFFFSTFHADETEWQKIRFQDISSVTEIFNKFPHRKL